MQSEVNARNVTGHGKSESMDIQGKMNQKKLNQLLLENGIEMSEGEISVALLERIASQKDTSELKVMLRWLGYTAVDTTGDSETSILGSLNEFRKHRDLNETDTMDAFTLQSVKQEFEASIAEPEGQEGVKQLKRNLNKLGFGKIEISDKLGNFTVAKIMEFQMHYDLPRTGEVSLELLMKIDTLLSEAITVGEKHDDLIMLKTYLNVLGYSKEEISLTNKFGKRTETTLKQFQKKNKLPVSGLLDEETKTTLREEMCIKANRGGRKNNAVIYIKETLNDLGFSGIEISSKVGSFAIQRLKEFQEYHGLKVTGIVDMETLLKFEEIKSMPIRLNYSGDEVIDLKVDLISLGYGPIAKTPKFGNLMEKRIRKFQRDHDLPANGIVDQQTMEKIKALAKFVEKKTFNYLDITLEEALRLQVDGNLNNEEFQKMIDEMENEFNPEVLLQNEKERFQLLDFSRSRVLTAETLDKYLKSRGFTADLSEEFLEAAVECGISEIVLISYALEEIKREYPAISGIPVDQFGNVTYTDGAPAHTSETHLWVYNVCGIGNSNDLQDRARKAFEEGWYTVERSIVGGAAYIKEIFLGDGRNTLYNKRWNLPSYNVQNKDSQLTRNKQWITEQLDQIYNMYRQLDSYVLYLDIPIYKKEEFEGTEQITN